MKRLTQGALAALLCLGFVASSVAHAAPASTPATTIGAKAVKADGKTLDNALEVTVIGKEGDRSILMVRNRTPFLILVYVRGVRMGWLRGYRTGIIRGLRPGYHRVYAHSRWGSTYWGPRVLYVPSRWTLYR
ncbi:MAG: hypothetical protein KC503_21280 [Myxococcales bacterium]|nr:hypothetical protein [Myxococcales bacterium]